MRFSLLILLMAGCGPQLNEVRDEGDVRNDTAMAPMVDSSSVERRVIPVALMRYLLGKCDEQLDDWRKTCSLESAASERACSPVVRGPIDWRDPCQFVCDCDGSVLMPPLGADHDHVILVPLP